MQSSGKKLFCLTPPLRHETALQCAATKLTFDMWTFEILPARSFVIRCFQVCDVVLSPEQFIWAVKWIQKAETFNFMILPHSTVKKLHINIQSPCPAGSEDGDVKTRHYFMANNIVYHTAARGIYAHIFMCFFQLFVFVIYGRHWIILWILFS